MVLPEEGSLFNRKLSAILTEPQAGWLIPGKSTGWTLPMFGDVRKLPNFKEFTNNMGLVDYWRASGNWGEFCHPLGQDDFECH